MADITEAKAKKKSKSRFKKRMPQIAEYLDNGQWHRAGEAYLVEFSKILNNTIAEYESLNTSNPSPMQTAELRRAMELQLDIVNKVEESQNETLFVKNIIGGIVTEVFVEMADKLKDIFMQQFKESFIAHLPQQQLSKESKKIIEGAWAATSSDVLNKMGRVFNDGIKDMSDKVQKGVDHQQAEMKKVKQQRRTRRR